MHMHGPEVAFGAHGRLAAAAANGLGRLNGAGAAPPGSNGQHANGQHAADYEPGGPAEREPSGPASPG